MKTETKMRAFLVTGVATAIASSGVAIAAILTWPGPVLLFFAAIVVAFFGTAIAVAARDEIKGTGKKYR